MAQKLIGYVRVSTEDQAAYGYGLDAQRAKIHDRHPGVRIVTDEGLSAKTLERPGLMGALQEIAAGSADGIVVAKLDRLTRSVIDFALLLDWFDAAGATLVALDFDLDTSTPGGRLIAHIIAAVAEWERDTISQRTKDGLAAARAQGKPTGRPSVADRPEVVMLIQSMKDDNLSLQQICDRLNADGIPTARGASEWRKSAVQSILGYRRRRSRRSFATLPELPVRGRERAA